MDCSRAIPPQTGQKKANPSRSTKAIPFPAEWKATESQFLSPLDLSLPLWRKKWESTRIGNIALLPFTFISRKSSKATLLNCFSLVVTMVEILMGLTPEPMSWKGNSFFLHPFSYFEEKKNAGKEKNKLHLGYKFFLIYIFSLNFGFRGHNKTF